MKPSLEKLREEIREKDREIVRLLNERARISVRIGQVKGQEGLAVYDPVQEAKVLDDLNTLNEGPLSDRQVSSIYREIISSSRDLQKPVAVAFLGPEASFSHLAARLHFGAAGRFVPESDIARVFDEVEKAHPEAHNILLQIMEEGKLSDAKGRKVDFRNCIIVMTSNIGADLIKRDGGYGFQLQRDESVEEKFVYEEMRKKLMDSLKKAFRPEFINRMDAVIVFHALNREHIGEIAKLELKKVAERLKEREITLTATEGAFAKLTEKGYDPEMGARPLRRVIQIEIEDQLSDDLLAGKFEDGDSIEVDIDAEGAFYLRKAAEPHPEVSEPMGVGM